MSWRAYRLPVLAVIGFVAPPLLVWGIKSIPPEWLHVADPPAPLAKAPELKPPVIFASRGPVQDFDPFRKILSGPTKPVVFAPVERVPKPPQVSAPIATAAPASSKLEPALDLPEPRLEGVVGGEDPVAVLKVGEESRFVREGENLGNGLQVISISDGEVRLKRGNSEIVLKTGA
jgi:hypothetical protein